MIKPARLVRDQLIAEQYEAGVSTNEIAAQHSLTPQGVLSIVRRWGCTLRPPGGRKRILDMHPGDLGMSP